VDAFVKKSPLKLKERLSVPPQIPPVIEPL